MQAKKTLLLQPEWMVAYLITVAAIFLHFYYWHHMGGLWRDEANLVNISGHHSFVDMAKDSFPVLMPLMVHFWILAGFGQSDLGIRMVGLFVGLGTLAVLWVSSWKTRRAPPLLGLALLGLNSTMIFFGDSLRAYGLGSLFVVTLVASAMVFLKKPSTSRALWFGLFALLSVQTLYHNAVVVAAVCIAGWVLCGRRRDGRSALQILGVAVISAASLLPYMATLVTNTHTTTVMRTGINLLRFFASYDTTLDFPIDGYIYDWILLAVVIFVGAGVDLSRKPGTDAKISGFFPGDDSSLFAAITLIMVAAGFPIFFWVAKMPMQSWYLLPSLAAAVTCFDAALPVFLGILRVVFLGFVALTALLSTQKNYGLLAGHFSNVNHYARALAQYAAPEDYIVVCPWNCGITFGYYFKSATPWDTLPPLADHSTHRFDLMELQMQNTNAIAPVLGKISETLQSGHRVWVLSDAIWIEVPKPGTSAISPLPPPPLKYFGWAESPYSQAWASETSHFIADHSQQFVQLQPPKDAAGERYIIENMTLFVAAGWKTNQPAP